MQLAIHKQLCITGSFLDYQHDSVIHSCMCSSYSSNMDLMNISTAHLAKSNDHTLDPAKHGIADHVLQHRHNMHSRCHILIALLLVLATQDEVLAVGMIVLLLPLFEVSVQGINRSSEVPQQ